MGKYKNIDYDLEKVRNKMSSKEIVEQLESLRCDRYSFITGEDNEIYVKDYVALEKAIDITRDGLKREDDYLLGLICMIVIMLVTIFTSIGMCEKYKSQLKEVVELRQNDLETSKIYIKDNNELKRQYEKLQSDYEYVVDIIRTSDKYDLPEGWEE
ncbi:MAG: hypothetical protein ACI4ON_00335 [Clostridia bacterium]